MVSYLTQKDTDNDGMMSNNRGRIDDARNLDQSDLLPEI